MTIHPSSPMAKWAPSSVHQPPTVRPRSRRLRNRLNASGPVITVSGPMVTFAGRTPSTHRPAWGSLVSATAHLDRLAGLAELVVVQPGIAAAGGQQFVVGSCLGDRAVVQDDDPVR